MIPFRHDLDKELIMSFMQIMENCGLTTDETTNGSLAVATPIDGSIIAMLKTHSVVDAKTMISASAAAFRQWRKVPAPRR